MRSPVVPYFVVLLSASCWSAQAGAAPPPHGQAQLSHMHTQALLLAHSTRTNQPWSIIEFQNFSREELGFRYVWPAGVAEVSQIVADLERQASAGARTGLPEAAQEARTGLPAHTAPSREMLDSESPPAKGRPAVAGLPRRVIAALLHELREGLGTARYGARWKYYPRANALVLASRETRSLRRIVPAGTRYSGSLCDVLTKLVDATATPESFTGATCLYSGRPVTGVAPDQPLPLMRFDGVTELDAPLETQVIGIITDYNLRVAITAAEVSRGENKQVVHWLVRGGVNASPRGQKR